MIERTALVNYLDELLNCSHYKDYAPNGLQIEGKTTISRICSAVTASNDVISQAIAFQADALIVHHGFFWRGESPVIDGMKRQRIGKLLANNINLFAYHLPLDCHPIYGNNACLAQLLSVSSVQMHNAGSVDNLLWSGKLSNEITSEQFSVLLKKQLGRSPLHIAGNNNIIRSIAWCSGAAQDYIENAHDLGVDAYLSGEVSERTYYQAMELGIQYYSCGHHATERYGVQAIAALLASSFNLEHLFLDSNNPI